MITLSVIVVLYNEFELVKKCLATIYQNEIPDMEVLLVDNSSDKSGHLEIIKKFPKIKYMQNKENVGFGRAVNIGIKHAKGKFFLILTPDTYLMPHTIKETVIYIKNNPHVGMVGCRIFSSPTKHERSASKIYPNLFFALFYYNIPLFKLIRLFSKRYHPTAYSALEHNSILFPKFIMGAYMLIRKQAIDEAGFFDPQYKLYMEDVDLCKRLHEHHWQVVYLPVGGLVNGDGGEWKKTTITQSLPNYMQSLYFFFRKHYGTWYMVTAWVLISFSALISIPYLLFVAIVKTLLRQPSQSKELLPLWFRITAWNFTHGIRLVLANKLGVLKI